MRLIPIRQPNEEQTEELSQWYNRVYKSGCAGLEFATDEYSEPAAILFINTDGGFCCVLHAEVYDKECLKSMLEALQEKYDKPIIYSLPLDATNVALAERLNNAGFHAVGTDAEGNSALFVSGAYDYEQVKREFSVAMQEAAEKDCGYVNDTGFYGWEEDGGGGAAVADKEYDNECLIVDLKIRNLTIRVEENTYGEQYEYVLGIEHINGDYAECTFGGVKRENVEALIKESLKYSWFETILSIIGFGSDKNTPLGALSHISADLHQMDISGGAGCIDPNDASVTGDVVNLSCKERDVILNLQIEGEHDARIRVHCEHPISPEGIREAAINALKEVTELGDGKITSMAVLSCVAMNMARVR